jgi:hypothetical protein
MSAGRGKEYVPAAPVVRGRVKKMVNARMIADRIESPHRRRTALSLAAHGSKRLHG